MLASAKDVAENIMIVDLVRHDLGRVARTGSVTVPELLTVRPAPGCGIWCRPCRLGSRRPAGRRTAGRHLPARVGHRNAQRPCTAIAFAVGAASAGVYCGTVGLASPVAGWELNVAIRTVEFDPEGRAVLGVGGGITADSNPDAEWQECLHKAAPIVAVLSQGIPRTQHRVVEFAPRRRAGTRVDHRRAGVLDPHPALNEHTDLGLGRQVHPGVAPARDDGDLPSTPRRPSPRAPRASRAGSPRGSW